MGSLGLTAQDLPRPSPAAHVEQVVGLTTITLQYSRPSVKGRKVWGELVPFDKVWRFGANEATRMRTSDDIVLGGEKVAAGYYAILATPSENGEWMIHINSDTTLRGAGSYDAAKDVAVLKAKTTKSAHTESFSLTMEDVTSNSANMLFQWDKVQIAIPITVPTDEVAAKNIQKAVDKGEDLDVVYYNAASYYFNSKQDEKLANEYIDKSMKVKETHRVHYLKGRMSESKGEMDKAVAHWKQGVALAKEAGADGWADFMQGLVDENSK